MKASERSRKMSVDKCLLGKVIFEYVTAVLVG